MNKYSDGALQNQNWRVKEAKLAQVPTQKSNRDRITLGLGGIPRGRIFW